MLKTNTKWVALIVGAALTLAAAARAQDSGPLVDLLVKKGIVTDQEAEELRAELIKDFAASSSAGKLNLSSSVSEFRISGDVRVRYEYRQGQTVAGDNVDRNRFRYRVRPLLSGKFGSQWFYGVRIENGSGSRSSNVTLGDDAGPWAKTNDGLYIGQVYLGYNVTPELTVIAGRMPNPFVTTSMVWDGDINPEGLAEQFKRTVGSTTYFANFGQFIYDSGNPQNALAGTQNREDQWLLGWQGGVNFKLDEKNSFQVAPTLYTYVNNKQRTAKNFGGAYSASNATAINNLTVVELPFEFNTVLPTGAAGRFFGDIAYNLDASDRARKFGRADLDSEKWAWQAGFQYGKAKLKGEWDAKVLYQQTGLFSLDPNLVDSDIFDSRLNAEGVVGGFNYQLSDAVVFNFIWANGKTKNKSVVSPGAGDIGVPTLKSYNLVQFDIVAKF